MIKNFAFEVLSSSSHALISLMNTLNRYRVKKVPMCGFTKSIRKWLKCVFLCILLNFAHFCHGFYFRRSALFSFQNDSYWKIYSVLQDQSIYLTLKILKAIYSPTNIDFELQVSVVLKIFVVEKWPNLCKFSHSVEYLSTFLDI